MPKRSQSLLNKKRARNTKEEKEIELNINNTKENFDLISFKLDKAKELFQKYNNMKIKKKNGKLLKMSLI